jgi:hypothetical protein
MKKLKDFLAEEVDATEYVERGSKDFNNDAVRDNINMLLSKAVSVCSITPYIAFEKVSKVLAVFHIHLPKTTFLEGDHGFKTFTLSQFGTVMGMRNDGEIVTKTDSPYTLYFEWKQNEKGMFDVFAEIVNDGELKDILDDVEEDINTEEPIEVRKDKMEERLDEGMIRSILSKVKKKVNPDTPKKPKKSLYAGSSYGLPGNDPYEMEAPRELKESKKKILKPKTNAPVLRAALAKAKTEIAQLKAAYKTPNQTKQPAKSMALSHPAPEPHETETVPLSKEKEEHIHQFGYLEEAKKTNIKKIAEKQRAKYVKRKGELPSILQKRKAIYNITQKEKKTLSQILSKQEGYRKEAKKAIKAARSSAPSTEPYSVPNETKQPAKSMALSHPAPKPMPHDFNSHLEAYHATGNKDHLKAARRIADMEHTREKQRIIRSGVSGAQHHVDSQWAKKLHKSRTSILNSLESSNEPKKGIMSRIKAFFKEETLLKEEYSK